MALKGLPSISFPASVTEIEWLPISCQLTTPSEREPSGRVVSGIEKVSPFGLVTRALRRSLCCKRRSIPFAWTKSLDDFPMTALSPSITRRMQSAGSSGAHSAAMRATGAEDGRPFTMSVAAHGPARRSTTSPAYVPSRWSLMESSGAGASPSAPPSSHVSLSSTRSPPVARRLPCSSAAWMRIGIGMPTDAVRAPPSPPMMALESGADGPARTRMVRGHSAIAMPLTVATAR
mmetsp:Transcript_6928/g.22995  ORF Transcript_6928/g.22995 Transcript_6928/m.22995 type:complete len:233 (+) Transcript_6928:5425-6123(+)